MLRRDHMPRRKTTVRTLKNDLSAWNFILFLTLAFILLVVVLTLMKNVSQDVRSKAGVACPTITLPRAEDCPGGWTYKRNVDNGCLAFFCEVKPTPSPATTQ